MFWLMDNHQTNTFILIVKWFKMNIACGKSETLINKTWRISNKKSSKLMKHTFTNILCHIKTLAMYSLVCTRLNRPANRKIKPRAHASPLSVHIRRVNPEKRFGTDWRLSRICHVPLPFSMESHLKMIYYSRSVMQSSPLFEWTRA